MNLHSLTKKVILAIYFKSAKYSTVHRQGTTIYMLEA